MEGEQGAVTKHHAVACFLAGAVSVIFMVLLLQHLALWQIYDSVLASSPLVSCSPLDPSAIDSTLHSSRLLLDAASLPLHLPTPEQIANPRVVVSMATFRQTLIEEPIRSILSGSRPPDAFYIFVPRSVRYFNISSVPLLPELLALRDRLNKEFKSKEEGEDLVRVHHVDDWGGNTKLLPLLRLETDPYTLLITIDDDNIYGADLVSTFVKSAASHPARAHHMAGENFGPHGGLLRDSNRLWSGSGNCMFGTGGDGNCYRRWFFDANRMENDLKIAPAGCFVHDDIWFAGNLWRRRIPRFKIDCSTCGYRNIKKEIEDQSGGKEQPQIHNDPEARYMRNTCADYFAFLQEDVWREGPMPLHYAAQ